MHRRVLLYSSLLLLCLILSATHAQEVDADDYGDAGVEEEDDGSFDDLTPTTTIVTSTANSSAPSTANSSTPSTANSSATSTAGPPSASTTKTFETFGSRYGYSKDNNKGSDGGYYDDSYELVGDGGKDPSSDGTDIGDFGPVYGRKPMLSLLDVWIRDGNDRGRKGSQYKNKPDGSYTNKNSKGSRNKRSYKKIRFPVKRIENYRKFPTKRFPPLISIFPWVPIFYDKRTYQTIIFSPTGGIYIIPPLINFYGDRFAVAQLIKWGYASLVSSGAPVTPGIDVAPLVQPPAVAAGGVAGPVFDASKSQFVGGVQTKFQKFKPRYPQTLEEGSSYHSPPQKPSYRSSKPNYGRNSDYGGTRDQTVYPQGGPPKSGGY